MEGKGPITDVEKYNLKIQKKPTKQQKINRNKAVSKTPPHPSAIAVSCRAVCLSFRSCLRRAEESQCAFYF